MMYLSLWIQSVKFEWEDGYHARCLKIPKNVSFNIASEASYVYILCGQKFIKNGQNGEFCQTEATCLTVLPDRPHLIEQKLIESAKIRNSNEAFFGDF